MVTSLLDALSVELKLQVMINLDSKSLLRFASVCGKYDHPSSKFTSSGIQVTVPHIYLILVAAVHNPTRALRYGIYR